MCQTIWSQMKLLSFTRGYRGLGEACPWWQDWLLKTWDGEINKSCSFLWILSSCGLQNLAPESPGLQNERLWSSPLPSFCCVLCLLDTFCQAEDTPFGKLCDHHKSSGNSKWIFRDTGQSAMWGKDPTFHFVTASPLFFLFFSVPQQWDHKKRQAGDSLPGGCVPRKYL